MRLPVKFLRTNVVGSFVALAVGAAVACSASSPDDGTSAGGQDAQEPSGSNGADPSPTSAGTDENGVGDLMQGDGDASVRPRECVEAVDVVFALDVSSSMGFVLDALESDIADVVTAANKLGIGDAHFGLVPFVDNHVLDTTGQASDGKVHLKAESLKAAFANAQRLYTNPNRNPGDGPKGPTFQNPICEENALDGLYAAAKEFPWRERATRVVIIATDDTFLDSPDNYGDRDGDGKTDKTDFPREGDYPARHSLRETIDALRQGGIRVFSFTRLKEPGFFSLTKCSTGRRLPWSSVSAGWSAPYDGTAPIPESTFGKNFDLEMVRDGSLSLSETIKEVVASSYCNPPPR